MTNESTDQAPAVGGEPKVAGCQDCERPYGDEHGFPDLIIPFEAWKKISPNKDDSGLLCPSCICKRLHDAGIKCAGAFMSGPIYSVSGSSMNLLRRIENIELAIDGRDNRWSAVRDLVTPTDTPHKTAEPRREQLVRAMCHVSTDNCECADHVSTGNYSVCRIVSRHADAVLAVLSTRPAPAEHKFAPGSEAERLFGSPAPAAEVTGDPPPEKLSGLFRIALGALASIAADEDTNVEAKTYAADVTRSLTEAAKKLSAVKEAGNGA